MQASRLLSILLLLQTRQRLTARALAEELEVSVRTIYRDVDELSAAGVPVYAEQGRSGGYRLLEGYRTRLTGLDRPEAEALFLSGLPGAAAQLGLGEALAKVRLKLLAALPEQARDDAERVAARFHLDPVSWFQGTDEQVVLPDLALAVWSRRTIRMRYDSWKGVVVREAVPLGLVLKAGLWYAVARSGGQVRTYRVASILDLEIGDAAPDASEPFDLPAHWAAFRHGYEERMHCGLARIRARPEALRELARTGRAAARAVATAGPPDDQGWQEVAVPIEPTERAVGELLRLGSGVEVLDPPTLRVAMAEAARRLHALYEGPLYSAGNSTTTEVPGLPDSSIPPPS